MSHWAVRCAYCGRGLRKVEYEGSSFAMFDVEKEWPYEFCSEECRVFHCLDQPDLSGKPRPISCSDAIMYPHTHVERLYDLIMGTLVGRYIWNKTYQRYNTWAEWESRVYDIGDPGFYWAILPNGEIFSFQRYCWHREDEWASNNLYKILALAIEKMGYTKADWVDCPCNTTKNRKQ
jgi:hypothetical protein